MSAEEPIPVVAAVIRRRGRILLGRRPAEKRHGGLWEFPGGKVDPGESLVGAARRELREELEMDVSRVGRELHSVADTGSAFVIRFVEVEAAGEPVAHEHSEIGWFTPAEAAELPLAPADAAFVTHMSRGSV